MPAAAQPNRVLRLTSSSIGQKLIMALTGLGLLGFVVGHLAGNLQMFAGDGEAINSYAKKLKDLGPLLWLARGGLLAIFVVHIYTAVALARQNSAARPQGYAHWEPQKSTLASRTMIYSGFFLLFFVAFHLAHFTFGLVGPRAAYLHHDLQDRHDVYNMVIASFENPVFAFGYVAALLVIGLHLYHGVASLLQTLGINHRGYNAALRGGAAALAVALAAGYIAIPAGVMARLVKHDQAWRAEQGQLETGEVSQADTATTHSDAQGTK